MEQALQLQIEANQAAGLLERFSEVVLSDANGCKLVWLVYPKKQIVDVITSQAREPFTIDETITGGDVLPDFVIPVREIFEG